MGWWGGRPYPLYRHSLVFFTTKKIGFYSRIPYWDKVVGGVRAGRGIELEGIFDSSTVLGKAFMEFKARYGVLPKIARLKYRVSFFISMP